MRSFLSVPLVVLFTIVVALAGANTAAAQTVRGSVTDAESGAPVAGATVMLLDATGEAVGGAFAAPDGSFVIRAPSAGRYTLRVQRIGFSDVDSAPFDLALGETIERNIRAAHQAVALAPITAQARRQCVVQPAQGEVLATLWNEARKALEATTLAERQALYRFRVRRHSRHLELPSLRVARDSTRTSEGVTDGSPFVSHSPDRLLSEGFIEPTDSGALYYAPDAHVLLSDEFSRAYCFRFAENRQRSLVGLAFEPAARAGAPAVRGTIWLDRETYALSHVDYRYTRTELPEGSADLLGGLVEFEPLPSGAWMVRRWHIRMPVVAEQQMRMPGGSLSTRHVLIGLTEEGGEVLEVTAAAGGGRVAGARLATLSGQVYDSVAGAPLGRAAVFLTGTGYATQADEQGRFTLDELPAGEFSVSFTHPKLNVYGVVVEPLPLSLGEGTHHELLLAVPAAAALAASNRCPARGGGARADEHAVLVGWASDELTGVPLAGATVVLSWQRPGEAAAASVRVMTGEAGMYVACGLPADRPIRSRVEHLGRTGAASEIAAIGATGFAEHDVELRIAEHGRLALLLTDWETAEPIANAEVRLPDSGARAVSRRDGRVSFEGLRPGEHRIEVEHIAYGTFRETVHVSGAATQVDVRIPSRAIALDAIEVTTRRPLTALDRARRSRGTRADILTRDDIDQLERTAQHIGDLVRRFPGLNVRETTHGDTGMRSGLCIESSRGTLEFGSECAYVAIVLDGMLLPPPSGHGQQADAYQALLVQLSVGAIESIEYLPAAEAGPRYGTGTRGGVLLIYTRGNGPYARPLP